MRVRRLDDPADFLDVAGPLLLADEARHNLILGLAGTLRDRPGYYDEFRLWVVEDDGRAVAAALQTPPFNLVLAQPADERALARLVDALVADDGSTCPAWWRRFRKPTCSRTRGRRGSRRHARCEGRSASTGLRKLRPVVGISGRRAYRDRRGSTTSRRLGARRSPRRRTVTEPGPASDAEKVVDGRLAGDGSGLMLWEDDGEPVSLAGWGGRTPNGIRIGPVYTPPDRRRRGYGSAVTAAVSAAPARGRPAFCFLYTDLANPTSNKIYVDIGYEPVCDAVDYAFES